MNAAEKKIYDIVVDKAKAAGAEDIDRTWQYADIRLLLGVPKELWDPNDPLMLVVSNQEGKYGALGILDKDLCRKVARRLKGKTFIILPSSIHEVICIAESTAGTDSDMVKMVTDINASEVLPEERLCDGAFRWNGKEIVEMGKAS